MNDQVTKNRTHTDADRQFYQFYAEQSISQPSVNRFESIRNIVSQLRRGLSGDFDTLDVADIGCNAGTQCSMWARDGHRVHGLDVNDLLLDLAKQRADEAKLDIDYRLGSAVDLPWADESMDICLVPELLEHVADWRSCLNEFTRILRPHGILYLSTTNYLCPKQYEFNLPLYSWYPAIIKQRYERLSMSTRPELANFAKFPAVNWFTFYSLSKELDYRGLDSFDRFDVTDLSKKSTLLKSIISTIRSISFLRWLGHVATPYTLVVAVKR